MTVAQFHFFIGTQGDEPGKGIHHGVLDRATGRLDLLGLAAEVRRPTWLQIDARNGRLFAVSELGNKGECEGEVLSFAIGAQDKSLRLIDRASSRGGGPTHLCLSQDGKKVFGANFGGGQACSISVESDGRLGTTRVSPQHSGSGPHPRQNKPHPHGVTLDPTGRFLLVPDMGNDQVVIHRFNGSTGEFAPTATGSCPFPAGSGPRLLLFSPDGTTAYVLSELSAELFVLRWEATAGKLEILCRSPLDHPEAEGASSAAAILMSADGRHLYTSNRRTHTIGVFSIDGPTRPPTLIQSIESGGFKPWGTGLSADGRWLLVANQASHSVIPFRVSERDGTLSAVAGASIAVTNPTHVAFS